MTVCMCVKAEDEVNPSDQTAEGVNSLNLGGGKKHIISCPACPSSKPAVIWTSGCGCGWSRGL